MAYCAFAALYPLWRRLHLFFDGLANLPTLSAVWALFGGNRGSLSRLSLTQPKAGFSVKIEAGYEIAFQCAHNVPMLLMLSVHPERQTDLLTEHRVCLSPDVRARDYLDAFGNICTRLLAPGGLLKISNRFIIADSGKPDDVAPNAAQWEIDQLPDETLVYLLGSRYCDTQKLSDLAWAQFGNIPSGWQRVQAICDYVHDRLEFGYHHARSDRTAAEGHEERRGVCRDFAHLAVTLCRCMNIPAQNCFKPK